MALSAPVDTDKTTPEETADLMRDFIEKQVFIFDYTKTLRKDNEDLKA